MRKILREERKSIPKSQKVIYDKIISEKIINSVYFKNAEQVLVFASTDEEFDTQYIVEHCRAESKSVFYPVCLADKGKMEFLKVNSHKDLHIGKYNILEPQKSCVPYKPKENDIIIVPALSADKQKYRIGYGGGYYDRFLKSFNGISICPCYSRLYRDNLPADEYDIKVSIVATDKEVFL